MSAPDVQQVHNNTLFPRALALRYGAFNLNEALQMPRRIEMDGDLLRKDRKRLGFSGGAMVHAVKALGGELSLKWLYEAERTNSMSESHLQYVAEILKLPVERYSTKAQSIRSTIAKDMRGKWRALYLQQDDMTPPYVSEEILTIRQEGSKIEGEYEPFRVHHPDPDEPVGNRLYWMKGTAENLFVRGEYGPHDDAPTGNGFFILKETQDGVWEGFCTFYTLDNRIALSLNIWIREGIRAYHSVYRQQFSKLEANKGKAWLIAPLVPTT